MLRTVYPISYSCYEGIFEFWVIMAGYYLTLYNPMILLYNSIHNFGNIYDDIGALVYRFTNIEKGELDWWTRIGFLIGDILHQFLFQPTDFAPYDESAEY